MANYTKVEIYERVPNTDDSPEQRGRIPIMQGVIRNTDPAYVEFLRHECHDAPHLFGFVPEGQGNVAEPKDIVLAQIVRILNLRQRDH